MIVENLSQAMHHVGHLLELRGEKVVESTTIQVDRTKYGSPVYHGRLFTNERLYHIKFQKQEQIPRTTIVMSGAPDADEKLKYTINKFGRGNNCLIGINLDVLISLLVLGEDRHIETVFVNVIGNGFTYWKRCKDIYEFSSSYGVILYNSKTYGTSIVQVPSGLLLKWEEPIMALPALCK